MSKAVYAKLWMATSQYHLRRNFGWMHVWKRLAPWGAVYAAAGVWLTFPAYRPELKKYVTFGIWQPPEVGYNKCSMPTEEVPN
ncbi:transmembrane protein [Babesia ovis]|uniref:Transmembrane protein n=1 Tax=Babesia ovis TaxID=5869 RepID=A0A9W5WUA0_BABOV|nr:transmembrane protein [Babesia ovis]